MTDARTIPPKTVDWLTPPHIIKALGPFLLDPCSPIDRPWDTAIVHYSLPWDGLSLPWQGRVWCNPPYGNETFRWIKKLSEHRSGIGLIFARTDVADFHKYVWQRAHSVFFFKSRLKFYNSKGVRASSNAASSSCLVSYSVEDTDIIKNSGLDGHLVVLRP